MARTFPAQGLGSKVKDKVFFPQKFPSTFPSRPSCNVLFGFWGVSLYLKILEGAFVVLPGFLG